ncbi:hypothetical protein MRB53_030610 [Persea americana]|uniref:Uncharacterized protein n=1 Tax=Persea americana TaxID=3435 RepID=A0ACC2KLT4_PERAE|nr:hypothetical protein MRB53_030610 [Persea americana]
MGCCLTSASQTVPSSQLAPAPSPSLPGGHLHLFPLNQRLLSFSSSSYFQQTCTTRSRGQPPAISPAAALFSTAVRPLQLPPTHVNSASFPT